jgi:hypothetical protein
LRVIMPLRPWTLTLVAALAFGQESVPFTPEQPQPWLPAWELTLRGDQLSNPVETSDDFRRADLQLRLRWSWDVDALHLMAGTRSAVGSDGNRLNAARWDQQPTNGTQLDMAHGGLAWSRERAFGALSLGLQENGLLVSQALWDRDLRFLGVAGSMGLQGKDGILQEAGLRAEAGRVRNILGGRMDLAAGQAVLKVDTGAWSWAAHAGRWKLSWDAGGERRFRLPGHSPLDRQVLVLDAGGASVKWNSVLPLEARWFQSSNRDTRDTSEEVQVTAGSRERTYWPLVSFTWQRLSSTGTLYPVNGDEWWFYRSARGPRLETALPLPGQWLASFIYLRQRADGDAYWITRRMLVLVKRF